MKRIIALVLVAFVVAVGMPSTAYAAVPPPMTEVEECVNPSGKLPPGQQPTCTGEAHDQVHEVRNPAGKTPPGLQFAHPHSAPSPSGSLLPLVLVLGIVLGGALSYVSLDRWVKRSRR